MADMTIGRIAFAPTPGPWRTQVPRLPITKLAAGDRMVVASAFDGSEKAIVDRVRGGTPEQANANALLIAAAPDLLAALKAAHVFISNGIELGFIRMPDADVPDPAHRVPDMVSAVIARAEGKE